jgi:hypothetical protein
VITQDIPQRVNLPLNELVLRQINLETPELGLSTITPQWNTLRQCSSGGMKS